MKTIHLEEINSTNDYVKKNIETLENLTFVYSDRQTLGRGRLKRKWIDTGDENLFLTIVIKPDNEKYKAFPFANFTQYLSVILCSVLENEYSLKPEIKWPNDVLVKGKKIAGILAEGTARGGSIQGLALGIGVNLNTTSENLNKIDKPATSIFNELGIKIDKKDFIKKLYENFCLLYDRYIDEGFITLKDLYLKRATFIGKTIKINVLDEKHVGIVLGVTDEGSLILDENNKTNIYCIGDII